MKKQTTSTKAGVKPVNNGTARTATPVKDQKEGKEVKTTLKVTETPEEVKPETKKEVAPLVTAETRMERLERMNVIANRHRLLKQKEREFFEFQNASDGSGEKLMLGNSRGLNFEVTNSEVIKITVNTLRAQLDGKIKETESELLAFEV